MIIHGVLYAWCLRYNICSAWFLDIRISTCYLLIIIYTLQIQQMIEKTKQFVIELKQ